MIQWIRSYEGETIYRGVIRQNFRTKSTWWIDSLNVWIDSDNKRTRQECMKDETIQCISKSIQCKSENFLIRFNVKLNRFSASQRILWYDSNYKETIHMCYDSRSCESIHLKSETQMSRFRVEWIDSTCQKMNNDTFSQDTSES